MEINCETFLNSDSKFPYLLKQIQNPPEKIFLLGEMPVDPPKGQAKIAIVGTRKATLAGKILAKNLAKELASRGFIIVSGLAMGIDTAAHEGCLEAQKEGNRQTGKTIAVLANGLDKIYPAQNENLAKNILKSGGALISEYPEGTPSYPSQFLERNRIVSGLCAATIVIEAPQRSGSLATARHAIEQGREVFVIPGPAGHPNYKGSHSLIRDGARLVSSIEDILEDLGMETSARTNTKNSITEPNQLHLLKVISAAGKPLGIDKIVEISKLDPQTVNQSIALLTIAGAIKETEHGYTL